MSSKLQQSKMKKTAEGAHQVFARSVRKNLHIFVIWDCSRSGSPFGEPNSSPIDRMSWLQSSRGAVNNSVHAMGTATEESLRAVFEFLSNACSHIDHYHVWSKQAYTDIALRYWQCSEEYSWQEWIETGEPDLYTLFSQRHCRLQCLYVITAHSEPA